MLQDLLLQTVNGALWGILIAMIALGLSLVFGLMGIINVAHGEFYMAGAVVATYIVTATSSFWVALVCAPLICGVGGVVIERVVLRPLEGQLVNSIIVTFGISMVLQQIALLVFGGSPQRVEDPIGVTFSMLGTGYPVYRLVVAGIGIAVMLALYVFLTRTKLGLWVRAVRQDREMAIALGIPVNFVYAFSFGVGAALAAAAGVMASPITAVQFNMGIDIVPLAFMAVIVGGTGRLGGALLAALLLGVLDGWLTVFTLPVVARVLTLLIVSLVLMIRPQGLMGSRL